MKVVHIKRNVYDVYIGRSKTSNKHYGNPFSYNPQWGIECKDREESVTNYKLWLEGKGFTNVEPQRREWILSDFSQLEGLLLG